MTPAPLAAARSFADDEALLVSILADVICQGSGEAALDLHERTVTLARAARDGEDAAADELAALVASLSLEDAQTLVRSLTRWFELVNLAEDNERVRRLRRRAAERGPAGRPGSVRDAVRRLADGGATPEQVAGLLAAAELRLVMIAHPT